MKTKASRLSFKFKTKSLPFGGRTSYFPSRWAAPTLSMLDLHSPAGGDVKGEEGLGRGLAAPV